MEEIKSTPPSRRMRIRRHADRAVYAPETVEAILDAGLICHLGVVVDGEPLVIPTGYGRIDRTLYLHGHRTNAAIGLAGGAAICITVSLLDGIVLACSAFGHSFNYRSGDRPTRAHWRSAFVIGLLLLAGGNGIVTFAEQRVPSGIAALLVATVPLWMAVFGHFRGVERMSRIGVAGLVVGFAGVGLLLRPGSAVAPVAWMALLLCAPVSWAFGSLYARDAVMPNRPLVGTAMEMICGGALLTVFAAIHGEWGNVHLDAVSGRSLFAFAFLIVFGSIVAYTAYVWLLRVVSPAAVSTYAYVNPLVAVALGGVFLNEPITVATLFAGGLIVIAVAVILASRGRQPRRRPTARSAPAPPVSSVA